VEEKYGNPKLHHKIQFIVQAPKKERKEK